MIRSLLAGAATVTLAMFVPQLPAFAQGGAITVTAPAARGAGEPSNGVNQRRQLIASAWVETRDLNLRTAYGRDLLERRVRLAADVACDRIDQIEPPTGVGAAMNPDSGDCRHLAAKNAEPQMRAAIRTAHG